MAISHLLFIVLLVSRPAGWMFGPILFAIGLIHSPNRLTTRPKTILLQLFSLSFPLALVVFGVNDVYDYPSDRRNPRKLADALEGTVLPPEHHAAVLYAAWAATVTIVSVSGLLFRRHNFAVVVALLLLSWQYSAPPLRFKERPILDSLSNGAIVDLAYLAGYTAGGGLLDERMLRVRGHVLALCTAGVHALGAAVDADVDAAAGQRTIATVFGGRAAVVFAGASYLLAFAVEQALTIFGVYILGGLGIVLVPLVSSGLTHSAFRAVVYWTVGMSALWLADKARAAVTREAKSKKVE